MIDSALAIKSKNCCNTYEYDNLSLFVSKLIPTSKIVNTNLVRSNKVNNFESQK